MNKRVLIIGSLITIPLVVLLSLAFDHDPNIVESPLIGKAASSFALEDFDGNRIDFADLRGKPVVLNFWASWCVPCIYENPYLVTMSKEYAGRVHFVGIVPQEDTPQAVANFQARLGTWGPTLWDSNGRVAIAYGVFLLPETYLIDSDGIIREKIAGQIDPESFPHSIESLL